MLSRASERDAGPPAHQLFVLSLGKRSKRNSTSVISQKVFLWESSDLCQQASWCSSEKPASSMSGLG